MNCGSVQHRLTLFLLGDLDAAERGRIEEHLAACDVCRAHVQDLQTTLDLLGGALADARAETGLSLSREARLKVMATRPGPLPSWSWVFERHPRLALAASVVAMVGLTWGIVANLRPVRPAAVSVEREWAERPDRALGRDLVAAKDKGVASDVATPADIADGAAEDAVPDQPVAGAASMERFAYSAVAKAVEESKRRDAPARPSAPPSAPRPVHPPESAAFAADRIEAPGLHAVDPALREPDALSDEESGGGGTADDARRAEIAVAREARYQRRHKGVAAPFDALAPAAVAPAPAAPRPALSVSAKPAESAATAGAGGAVARKTDGGPAISRDIRARSGGENGALGASATAGPAPEAVQTLPGYEAVRRSLAGQVWPPRAVVAEGVLQSAFQRGESEDRAVTATVARLEDLLRRGPFGAKVEELDTVADELESLAQSRANDPRLVDLARMARSAAALIRGK